MDQINGFRVAAKLEKKNLLLAINSVAALSIFFFGYDQVGTYAPIPVTTPCTNAISRV